MEQVKINKINFRDFSGICRFCMDRHEIMMPIFKEKDEPKINTNCIDELTQICLGMMISPDDGLPLLICVNCNDQLIKYHDFRKRCYNSFEILQDITKKYHQTIKNKTDFQEDIKDISFIDNDNDEDYITKYEAKMENGLTKYNGKNIKIENHANNHRKERNQYKRHRKYKKRNNYVGKDMQIKIRKPRPEMCEICGQMQTNLKMHLRVHKNLIVFECDHCGRKFNQKSNIKTHFKVHLNKRPFHCTLCPYKFLQLAHLQRHMLTHTGEKPYKCDICPKAFAQSSSLAEHRLIHTQDRQVPCPHCDKMFLTKKALKSHVGIHTGERPFKCEICGLSYVSSSGLSAHRRIHKRENPSIQCEICQQIFETKKIWKNHMRDHGFRIR